MKLTDISDDSLSKIFGSFSKDLRNIARFARINDRFFNFGETDNRLKKDFQKLHVSYCNRDKDMGIYVYTDNTQEPKYKIRFYLRKNTIIGKMSAMIYEYYNKVVLFNDNKDSTALDRNQVTITLTTWGAFFTKLPSYHLCLSSQNPCASLHTIVLYGLVIDEEFLHFLTGELKPLLLSIKLKKLKFESCTLECTEKQMCEVIRELNIKELTLRRVTPTMMKISNVLLSQVPDRLSIWGSCSTDRYRPHEVDDQLLMNWLYKTPEEVKFYIFTSQITLSGVVLFIEKFCKKVMANSNKTFKHKFELGLIYSDNKNSEILVLSQRNLNLTWTIHNINDFTGTEDCLRKWYTVSINGHDVIFTFNIYSRQYNKITKQQARNHIPILREKIEGRRRNRMFFHRRNRDIMDEIRILQEGFFPEWNDVSNEIYKLTVERIPWWQNEDGENIN